ncbi:MAG: hypothetical protein PHN92_00300 [Geobacter sp.]|nr:hypothetical protein [Geobacter sp.]
MPIVIGVMVSNISWLWLVLGAAAVKDGWGIKGIKAGVCVWMMVFADVMFLSDVRNQAVPAFLLMACSSCIISGSV